MLAALASTDGLVDNAALIEAAWPGTIVEEGNLMVQIAALRKTPAGDGRFGVLLASCPRRP